MTTILDRIRHVVETLKSRGKMMMTGHQQQEGDVDEALIPLQKELQGALDQLRSLKQEQNKCTPKDLHPVREVLGHIDSLYNEGKFRVEGVEGIPHGQAKLADMLNEAHEMLRECLESCDFYKVSPELRHYHDVLTNIQHALDSIKDKADLSPKDIRPYRQRLYEIDEKYEQARIEVNHQFPEGQAIVAELLSNAHETIRQMLMKTDYYQVDQSLMSVHDRLHYIIDRLEALSRKDQVNDNDLTRLRARLEKVDSQWKEGKIEVGGQVPSGQAIISDMLEKAHSLMQNVQQKMKA